MCKSLNETGFSFIEDTLHEDYVYNWQQEMNLMCEDRNTINYIVTAYFICYGIAGFILFPLPDKWGCRKIMMVFGSIHVFC